MRHFVTFRNVHKNKGKKVDVNLERNMNLKRYRGFKEFEKGKIDVFNVNIKKYS